MSELSYIVVGRNSWNKNLFDKFIEEKNPTGQWRFVSSLNEAVLQSWVSNPPRYIFFLHWSEKVPESVLSSIECVCFHMTDVPFGRGGSPLQNLIIRGFRQTKLTALRMVEEFDAGPIYGQSDLSLEGSSAEEVYCRATKLSLEMAENIALSETVPTEQEGNVVKFRRRKPEESEIPSTLVDLESLHDFIRMLDADGYPRAFLDLGAYRIEFEQSTLYHDSVKASVTFRKREHHE